MGDAAEQAQAEEQLQEGGGGKSKLPFILAGLAVFLIIVLAIAFMLFSGSGSGSGESVVAEITKAPAGYNLEFPEPFTTNLAPPDDQYIFSTTITLELKSKGSASQAQMLAELGIDSDSKEIRMPAVKDRITSVLATKTRQEVNSEGGRQIIRTEIKRRVNEILEKGEVINVFLYGYSTN